MKKIYTKTYTNRHWIDYFDGGLRPKPKGFRGD